MYLSIPAYVLLAKLALWIDTKMGNEAAKKSVQYVCVFT